MILQTRTINSIIISIGIVFSSNFNLFSLHTLAWACILTVLFIHYACFPLISTMPLYISAKFVLLFILCILYMLKNLQAKITTESYYRTHFTQQSKTFHNSKPGLLFFLKLQNHSLN